MNFCKKSISLFLQNKFLNAWISEFTLQNHRKILNLKKFVAFDTRKKSPQSDKFSLILGIDKKEMNLLQKRKEFYWRLKEMNKSYLQQKFFKKLLQYGVIRRKNKIKARELENLINSRSAICFLKIWHIKSEKRIEIYKKIGVAVTKMKNFTKKKFFKGICKNLSQFCEFSKKEEKAEIFFKIKKKEKVWRILSILLEKRKMNKIALKYQTLAIKFKMFGKWKTAFSVLMQEKLQEIKSHDFFTLNLKKKLMNFYFF